MAQLLHSNLHSNNAESRARWALETSPIFSLRQLHVEQVDDELHLLGRVDSYYHKQLAQEVVRGACDGAQVVNLVDVG